MSPLMRRSLLIILLLCLIQIGLAQGQFPSNVSQREFESLKQDVEAVKEKTIRAKDSWDKLGALSTIISGLLVTSVGIYATQKYTARQREKDEHMKERELLVQQIQVVEKFFPYLTSGDYRKVIAAIQTIRAIGNNDIALNLARIFENSVDTPTEQQAKPVNESALPVTDTETDMSAVLISKLMHSIVRLDVRFFGGSAVGYFCNEWGLIITIDKVADDFPKALVTATDVDTDTCDAQVWLRDQGREVALLSSRFEETGKNITPLLFLPQKAMPETKVITVGHTRESSFIPIWGKLSKFQILEPERICVDLEYLEVLSGSPVITEDGGFIGIISEYNMELKQAFLIPSTKTEEAFIKEKTDRQKWEERKREEYMIKRVS